ncbi:MAG: hypothetical protein ACTSRA_19685, partial [Promethearchaeota archaeon]
MIEGWEFLLAQACIVLLLVFSIYYFNKARKTDDSMTTLRNLNYGFAIMFLFLFISRVLDNPLALMTNPANDVEIFGWRTANQELYNAIKYFDYEWQIVAFPSIYMWMFVNAFFLIGLSIAVFFMER